MTAALITGAAGFVAQHLAGVLRQTSNSRIVGVDVREIPDGLFDERIILDLTDADATLRSVRLLAPSMVFHLAGAARGSEDRVYASNVTTAANLVDALLDVAPEARIVLIGSAAEYGIVPISQQPVTEQHVGTPVNSYGRSKAHVSALARTAADRGQRVAVVRPFNVLGPGVPDALVGGAIVHRLRTALAGPPPHTIRIGRTTGIRDFVAAEDAARAIVLAAEKGRTGEAYNVCSGEGHAIAEVLDQLLALADGDITVEEDSSLLRQDDVDAMVGSHAKATRELDWTPRVSFTEMLQATWFSTADTARAADA